MATTKYIYTGPISGITLDSGEEILLTNNKEVALPDSHPYVISLVAQGFLEAVPVTPKQAKPETQQKEEAK